MMRTILLATLLCVGAGASVMVAEAATISRDALERKLLDTCVYRQFEVKDVKRASMIDNCRCATRTAMQSIEGDSFDQPRSGGLTGPQDQAIRAGISACFKS